MGTARNRHWILEGTGGRTGGAGGAGDVLAHADALCSQVSQWLRALSHEEMEAPARLLDRMRAAPPTTSPPILDATAPFEGQPAWLALTLACFAYGVAALWGVRLFAGAVLVPNEEAVNAERKR